MAASRSARAIEAVIVLYQKASSGRLPRCRFHPTCSQYAREAIAGHGAVKGSWLAARRLGRCHPLGGHGFDPVPEPTPARLLPSAPAHPFRRVDPC